MEAYVKEWVTPLHYQGAIYLCNDIELKQHNFFVSIFTTKDRKEIAIPDFSFFQVSIVRDWHVKRGGALIKENKRLGGV